MSDEERWNRNYELAKAYYEHHHNLKIVQTFKTENGYEYDEDGVCLGTWISQQRTKVKTNSPYKPSKKQIAKLNEIGMIWDPFEAQWQEFYELAKKYYEHHGDLLVPMNFRTKDGYTYDKDGILLGQWINNQREAKKGIGTTINTRKRTILLNKIGMVWEADRFEARRNLWNEKLALAKNYYETYGNLKITYNFRTKDGITYDEDGIKMGIWIARLRSAKKGKGNRKITKKRIAQLDEIGMIWDASKIRVINQEGIQTLQNNKKRVLKK